MHHSRFMPIAYLSDVTSDLLRAASSSLVSIAIRAHPIKPSATRVLALMNPSPRLFPFPPLIPNNELYERTLPHSARRAVTSSIVGDIDSVAEVDSAPIRADCCCIAEKQKVSRGAMIHDRHGAFDGNESRGYSNYSPRLVASRYSEN